MKLKKTILGMAVVAVAGVNVWLANDVNARNNVLSMLNLENIAEATECVPGTIESGKSIRDGRNITLCCEVNEYYECSAMVWTEGSATSGMGKVSGKATEVE